MWNSAMARAERPLSPHLQIYRWYFTMALSIAHRITGVGLALGLVLFTWWLLALASGPEAFAIVHGVMTSWVGAVILFFYTLTLFYHMGNGIRHLVWDFGYGFDLQVARAGRGGVGVCGRHDRADLAGRGDRPVGRSTCLRTRLSPERVASEPRTTVSATGRRSA
jgi:succinate dehydrogenase / fumarate reductase cytochrome b subunit